MEFVPPTEHRLLRDRWHWWLGPVECSGKRHDAFVRATVRKSSWLARACESAVAAGALPAQSKTRTELPGASQLRGASWTAAGSAIFGESAKTRCPFLPAETGANFPPG